MSDGNSGSPYRRSSHHRVGGRFSPMHTGGASSGANFNYYVDDSSGADGNSFSSDQGLWDDFETVACSVTDLYRNPSWNVFQRTASAATQFYKGSVDACRRSMDTGITIGRQVLCKEIIHWLQTSNPSHLTVVRRDDLVNFILARATTTAPTTTDTNAGSADNAADFGNSSPMQTQQRQDSPSSVAFGNRNEPLEIFQEALAVPAPPTRQNFASAAAAAGDSNNVGLTAFFVEECRRHARGKRRRVSPDHNPYYLHSNNATDLPPDGNGNGSYWHPRPAKRSKRF